MTRVTETSRPGKYRKMRITVWLSGITCLLLLVLAVASPWLDPSEHHFAIRDDFQIGVTQEGWDVRLAFFNTGNSGPYRGSTVGVSDSVIKIRAIGDTAGIYYRHVSGVMPVPIWSLMVSIWYPIALAALLPSHWFLTRKRRSATIGYCPACGYDLRGSDGPCPECGEAAPTDAGHTQG